jgi:hypothetical protein
MSKYTITEVPIKFQTDDRVRVKATGKEGTIRGPYGYRYNVRHDDGTYWAYKETELEVLPGVP